MKLPVLLLACLALVPAVTGECVGTNGTEPTEEEYLDCAINDAERYVAYLHERADKALAKKTNFMLNVSDVFFANEILVTQGRQFSQDQRLSDAKDRLLDIGRRMVDLLGAIEGAAAMAERTQGLLPATWDKIDHFVSNTHLEQDATLAQLMDVYRKSKAKLDMKVTDESALLFNSWVVAARDAIRVNTSINGAKCWSTQEKLDFHGHKTEKNVSLPAGTFTSLPTVLCGIHGLSSNLTLPHSKPQHKKGEQATTAVSVHCRPHANRIHVQVIDQSRPYHAFRTVLLTIRACAAPSLAPSPRTPGQGPPFGLLLQDVVRDISSDLDVPVTLEGLGFASTG